ncbi:OmpP1/FadL family transporter [Fulvivirga sedimenti]|uniref:Aromatic hydrocarbon degradation protein n=1 Tax=Fulvivirga sedimenti TaxID=2879465 RepID=A0A9X1HVD1_9BACT|nr:hypothetical protein [Fulvivirga sedimenti]MCA6078055.1 hypothetical protein [Fulvivirga sedimenti]
MKKLLIVISLGMVCTIGSVQAQDATDFPATALEITNTYNGGSARLQALGGAGTAIGGDISTAHLNPAGLGLYNRSEFSFTPSMNFITSEADYLGVRTMSSINNFNMANIGGAIHRPINKDKWLSGTIGISVNRIANFQNSIVYIGDNAERDFIDFSVDSDNFFNGLSRNDLSDLAYNTFMTDDFYSIYQGQETISINGFDYNVIDLYGPNVQIGDSLFFVDRNTYRGNDLGFPTQEFPTRQSETIRTRGGVYQTSLSYGANYDDRVYLGIGVGILTVRKEVERTYREEPTATDLINMTLTDDYRLSGVGANITLGLIVRPITPLMIAASYTSPSWYALEQSREIAMYANFDNELIEDGFIYPSFQYNLQTPHRFRVGGTFILGKAGFITAEAENVKFANASLSKPSEGAFTSDNNYINNTYQDALNFRGGAEIRLAIFRIRAGYAFFADPTDDGIDNEHSQFSGGVGIRTKTFFADLSAVTNINQKSVIVPYPTAEAASVNTDMTRVSLTIGMLF